MSLQRNELETPRTAVELRAYIDSIRSKVRANTRELEQGMLKRGIYKEFLDEVVPLCAFVELRYPSTYTVAPVVGNQGYDATVYDEGGVEFERIELTRPHFGQDAADEARAVLQRGIGRFKVGDPVDDLRALMPLVLDTCRKKAVKDYSDCTLVVVVDVTPPYVGFESHHESKVAELTREIAKIRLRAKRVFLMLLPSTLIEIV